MKEVKNSLNLFKVFYFQLKESKRELEEKSETIKDLLSELNQQSIIFFFNINQNY